MRLYTAILQYFEIAISSNRPLENYIFRRQFYFTPGISVFILFLHAHTNKGDLTVGILGV